MCLWISILITSCGRQGIDHPDSIAVKRKFSLSDGECAIAHHLRNGTKPQHNSIATADWNDDFLDGLDAFVVAHTNMMEKNLDLLATAVAEWMIAFCVKLN